MVGGTPANNLRVSLANEAEAAARQAAEGAPSDKRYQQLVNDAHKDGTLGFLFPNYYADEAAGKIDKGKVLTALSRQNAEKYALDHAKDKLSYANESDVSTKKTAYETAAREAQLGVTNILTSAESQLGQSFLDLSKQISTATASGKLPQGQALINMQAGVQKIRLDTEQTLNLMFAKPFDGDPSRSYGTMLSPEEITKIKANAMMPVMALEEALTGDKNGLFRRSADYLKAQQDGNASRLLQVMPEAGAIGAAKTVLGEAGAAYLMNRNPEIVSALADGLSQSTIVDLVNGNSDNLLRTFNSYATKTDASPEERQAGITDVVNKLVATLRDDVVSPEVYKTLATAVFSKDNGDFLKTFSADGATKVFTMLSNGDIAAKMKEMSSYDPQIWSDYKYWVTNNFFALNKAAIDELQATKVNRAYVDVSYDPKTAQFRVDPRKDLKDPAGTSPFASPANLVANVRNISEYLLGNNAQKTLDNFNRNISAIKPFLKMIDMDPNDYVKSSLAAAGVDITAKYEGPALDAFMPAAMGVSLGQKLGEITPEGVKDILPIPVE
jgi:hypothetical protein